MSVWVRDRGLLIANLALFLIFLVGMVVGLNPRAREDRAS